jgi:hypothetical protein
MIRDLSLQKRRLESGLHVYTAKIEPGVTLLVNGHAIDRMIRNHEQEPQILLTSGFWLELLDEKMEIPNVCSLLYDQRQEVISYPEHEKAERIKEKRQDLCNDPYCFRKRNTDSWYCNLHQENEWWEELV